MKQTIFSAIVILCSTLVGYWWLGVLGILTIDIFALYQLSKRKDWSEAIKMLLPSFGYQISGMAIAALLLYLRQHK